MLEKDVWLRMRWLYGAVRAPSGLEDRVMAALASGRRRAAGLRRWGWVGAAAAAMAAAVLLAVEVSTERVTFAYTGPVAESVALVGDFNGWSKDGTRLRRSPTGGWTVTLRLPRGVYRYQFLVDGTEWSPDPSNPVAVEDGYGGKVSVLDV